MVKGRAKKPFNPMLGETYELVTEDYRWVAEQVSHHPPITAFFQQGKGYCTNGFVDSKSSLGLGSGTGIMDIRIIGHQDTYFEKYDETISTSRPRVKVENLVFGTTYVDYYGELHVVNHKTGHKATVSFEPRGWTTESKVSGTVKDPNGTDLWTLRGSWANEIKAVDA